MCLITPKIIISRIIDVFRDVWRELGLGQQFLGLSLRLENFSWWFIGFYFNYCVAAIPQATNSVKAYCDLRFLQTKKKSFWEIEKWVAVVSGRKPDVLCLQWMTVTGSKHAIDVGVWITLVLNHSIWNSWHTFSALCHHERVESDWLIKTTKAFTVKIERKNFCRQILSRIAHLRCSKCSNIGENFVVLYYVNYENKLIGFEHFWKVKCS